MITPTFTAADYAARHPEGCGVVGVSNHPDAARIASLALYALQHRGQESAGICVSDRGNFQLVKNIGRVSEIFTEPVLRQMTGNSAIGHVRYSTTGETSTCNAQPLMANLRKKQIAISHNGNLTNADKLAEELELGGAIYQSTTDSELLLHLIAQDRAGDFGEALHRALTKLEGAYSFAILHDQEMWAVKDPCGIRPLCLGRLGDAWIVASETCALDVVGATFLRELAPGEIVRFSGGEVTRPPALPAAQQAFCVFELIYYSRPDSLAGNRSIYNYRIRLGAELAREHPVEADVVVPVPDSSNPAAIGYAREAGLPLEMGLIRSHYVGRTFIQPAQEIRDFAAKLKYNPVQAILNGRRVVLVDDSIVRGTTSTKIVRMVRDAGAKEVHFRVTAPPWKNSCYYGVDTPNENELLANKMTVEEMRDFLGVDSLGFISMDGVKRSVPPTMRYCDACFTGDYQAGRIVRQTKLLRR